MSTNDYKREWTLKEISEWAEEDSQVSIPAFQRGLVWKPHQVELLWDSILRQFPIGSFTLSVSTDTDSSSYSLLDGQQRWNAISLGYTPLLGDISSARSILWFDLKPEDLQSFKSTTRKYMIRVTTKAHPWGYEANDECSRFNTAQKREALAQLNLADKNIYKDGISLSETYPVQSGLPIPLFWLLEAGAKSNGNRSIFVDCIKAKVAKNKVVHTFKLKDEAIPDDLIAKYEPVFENVTQYRVPTIYLDQRVIDKESETEKKNDNTSLTDIEILFARIGTGGTQITQNELIYSAIKAYWPQHIKDENDRLASLYMPPFSLISMAFRLSLSPTENGNLSGALSVKKVRQIASDKYSEAYQSILKLYSKDSGAESELETILNMVDSWLTKDKAGKIVIPTVLRTGIARTSPDVYLLLMSIAKRVIKDSISLSSEDVHLFRALAFYFHWMVYKDSRNRAVASLYKSLHGSSLDTWPTIIKRTLMELYAQHLAFPLIPTEDFRHLFGDGIGSDPKWRLWDEGRSNKSWWPLWGVLSSNREMLVYAQREYMCNKFPNYDPAKLDLWEEYNRPWDYDHIVPQDWIYQYKAWRKKYSDYCCQWKDNNGNIAAIPFEINRTKSNTADWTEYVENKEGLLSDEEIEKYHELFNKSITEDKEQAHRFAIKTFARLCKIYVEVYELLSPVDVNSGLSMEALPTDIAKRYKRLIYISEKLACKTYYECNGKDYPITSIANWACSWISTGIITTNGYYAAITMEINSNSKVCGQIEIGLRRLPDTNELAGEVSSELIDELNATNSNDAYEKTDGPWWHVVKYLPLETNNDEIIKQLKSLADFATTNLE